MWNRFLTYKHIASIAIILFFTIGCVEPFDFESKNFDSLIVVNGVLTDELKFQKIFLANTTPIDESTESPETGAIVKVIDDLGSEYLFVENESGTYISTEAFGIIEGVNYTLNVKTRNGREYSSEPASITSGKKPVEVRAVNRINDLGDLGVDILVSSIDETNSSKYYRYEYEETYKIIAPYWAALDIVLGPEVTCGVPFDFQPKTTEQEVCYNTVYSNRIIQTNTLGLDGDNVGDFSVRFIPISNDIIHHRYSILVKQYVQSREAHAYYEKLNSFIEEGNLFTQIQAGFIQGNMYSVSDRDNENVLGFFEVSTVVEERIFFSFEDIFQDIERPDSLCNLFAPTVLTRGGSCNLYTYLEQGYMYYTDNPDPGTGNVTGNFGPGPYIIVSPECGDCTVLGSAEVPSFWID